MKDREAIEPCPAAKDNPKVGMGRSGRLAKPTLLTDLVAEVKKFLDLEYVPGRHSRATCGGKPVKK